MLPLQQAYEVKHSLIEYLKATFRFKDKGVHDAFYDFIIHSEDEIIKGLNVSLKNLPFVTTYRAENTGDVFVALHGVNTTDNEYYEIIVSKR